MVLPISMSVHEIQCGSLVHFCMVNLGYKKSGHRSKSKKGGFETGPYILNGEKIVSKIFRSQKIISPIQNVGEQPLLI